MKILLPRRLPLTFCLAAACGGVLAQGYPNKPVRVIIPLPAGSPAEVPARAMSDALSKVLGQPFIVENKPGADQIIGADACAKAPPDGYTLCGLSHTPMTINPLFHAKLPYDYENGFSPIGYLGRFVGAVVASPKLAVNTVPELIELAKAKPESLSWATLGGTSMGPMYNGWFKQNTGASFLQVPYKGSLEGFTAVMAGDVSSMVIAVGPTIGPVKAGRAKMLAVTSANRWPAVPDVPTLKEVGIDMPPSFNSWIGIFAPAGVPADIIRRLNAEMVKVMNDPGFKARIITATGLEADDYRNVTPAEFAAFIKEDREVINKAAAAAGIRKPTQ